MAKNPGVMNKATSFTDRLKLGLLDFLFSPTSFANKFLSELLNEEYNYLDIEILL